MVYRNQKDIRLTILGLGHIGSYVAERLTTSEYNVRGWSNSIKTIPGVETFAGMSELTKAVTDADVVICLLALNEQTRGIIDDDLFSAMAEQSCFINVARGAHLDDDAFIKALDTKLICAFLDVFANEPLPEEHPFWERNEIVITPHIASLTDPGVAAEEVLQRYYALK